jgi:hypothetical protein
VLTLHSMIGFLFQLSCCFPFTSAITKQRFGGENGSGVDSRCNEMWVCGEEVSQGMKQKIRHAYNKRISIRYVLI